MIEWRTTRQSNGGKSGKRPGLRGRAIAIAIAQKLRSRAGDTLVEVLVAILIAALGATALATMTLTATTVINKNEAAMAAIYEAEQEIAQRANGEEAAVRISGGGLGGSVEVPVWVYDDTQGDFKRFEVR
jgi:type II secretory pathway pseudopilin PulG